MKNTLLLSLVVSLAWTGSMALAQNTKPFPDVPKDHWAYQAVMELKEKSILIGYPDGTFNGEGTKRLLSPKSGALQDKANDVFFWVPADHWAYKSLDSFQAAGFLVNFYPAGHFRGQDQFHILVRYEFAIAIKEVLEIGGVIEPIPEYTRQYQAFWQQKRGEATPPAFTLKQLQDLLQLTEEFKKTIDLLRLDTGKIRLRLTDLAQQRIHELQSAERLHFDFEMTPGAYLAYQDLREAALLERPDGRFVGGYPDIQRYNLAVSLKRALEGIFHTKEKGTSNSGIPNSAISTITSQQVQELLLLVGEFKGELASLGVDVRVLSHRLENLKTAEETPPQTIPMKP